MKFTKKDLLRPDSTFILKTAFFLSTFGASAWLTFFYIYLEDSAGLRGGQIGIIAAVQQFATIFMLPVWGLLADKFGRRKVLLIALCISSLTLLLFMPDADFKYYLLMMLFVVLFTSPVNTLLDSIALDFVQQYKKSSYGELRLWASIGWSSATLLIGQLLNIFPLQIIFPVATIAIFLNFLMMLFLYKPLKIQTNPQVLSIKNAYNLFAKNRFLMIFFFLLMLYGTASPPVFLFLNLYIKEIGGTASDIGIAFAIQSVSEFPFFFWGKYLITKFGAKKLLVFSMIVTAVRFGFFSIINDPSFVFALSALHGITFAVFMISIIDILHKLIPAEWKATAQSLFYASFFGAGIGLGNLVMGYLKDIIGMQKIMYYDTIWTAFIIIAFTAFFGYGRIKNKLGRT